MPSRMRPGTGCDVSYGIWPVAGKTDHSDATDSLNVRHSRQDGGIKAGGLAVEVDILNAICAAHQRVVAPRFEEAVDHGLVLEIRTLDDQREVVGWHSVVLLFDGRLTVGTLADQPSQLFGVVPRAARR